MIKHVKKSFVKLDDNIKNEILSLYDKNKSCYFIAKNLGLSIGIIRRFLIFNGKNVNRFCKFNKNNLLKNDKNEIIKLYTCGNNFREIEKMTGHNHLSIIRLLVKLGIHKTKIKYTINEKFFQNIDNEFNAYILGLLYADGCIKSKNVFALELSAIDKDILYKIQNIIKYTGKIYYSNKKRSMSHQDKYSLIISSKQCIIDLINLGCISKKSLILKFPTFDQIPLILMSHFLRGYFDGDGCISNPKDRFKGKVSIVSSYDFIIGLQKFLAKELNIFNNIILCKKNNKTAYLCLSNYNKTKIFLDYIYKDITKDSLYLERKYKRFRKQYYEEEI